MMVIVDLVKKAFIGGVWYVGYREKGEDKYHIIPNDNSWIADPFLFEYQDEHYLFVEYVKKNKGEIAYFKFVDNKPVFQKVVISEPYHLSYPCILTHENGIYMIPESADNHSIDLYRATVFPDKWEKVCQLAQGIYYDTTYVNYQGKDYLISYSPQKSCYELSVFAFNINDRKIEKIATKQYKENIGRPAGNLYKKKDRLIRPAQDCSRKYGENLLFYKFDGFNAGNINEVLTQTLSVKGIDNYFQRIHTYNCDSFYETVDFFKEKFRVLRPIKILRKKLRMRTQN